MLNPASGIHWPRVAGASFPDEAYDQDIPLGTGADFARSTWNAGIHNFPPVGPGAWATKWALEKFAIADEPADSFASAAGVVTYFGVTAVAGGVIEAVEAGGAAGLRGLLGAAEAAPGAVSAYEVGTFESLAQRSVVGDAIDLHHAGQAHAMEQVVPGYSRATGPAIALPHTEHALIPNLRGPVSLSPRQLLARDIWNLRRHTNAPNNSLRQLIQLNKQMFPEAFAR